MEKAALGNALAAARRAAGLSQAEAARALGITDKAVSKWETGASYPAVGTLARIAELYGMKLSSLFASLEGAGADVAVVCITGGPGTGKTSALAYLLDQLSMRGWRAIVASETATELIEAGVTPVTCGSYEAFQQQVLRVSLAKEDACRAAAQHMEGARRVVVCDRGGVDIAAYLTRPEYERVLSGARTSTEELFERYDAVVCMQSAAAVSRNAYEFETNGARGKSPSEAAARDAAMVAAWQGHPCLVFVPGTASLSEKMRRAVNAALAALGEAPAHETRRTWLVRRPSAEQLDVRAECTKMALTYTFIAQGSAESSARYSLLVRCECNDATTYELRRNHFNDDEAPFAGERVHLTFRDYHALEVYADPDFTPVSETRFVYATGAADISVCLYDFFPYQALVHVMQDDGANIGVPEGIQVIREVTENPAYTVRGIARALAQNRI